MNIVPTSITEVLIVFAVVLSIMVGWSMFIAIGRALQYRKMSKILLEAEKEFQEESNRG